MGWSRVSDPSSLVKPGDDIAVKILRIETKAGEDKIALGMKQLADDPWQAVPAKYSVGHVTQGRVSRVAEFGVFVELEPGIVGLVPRSETGVANDADLKKMFAIGAHANVIVLEVDAASRRIRLSITGIQKAEEAADVRDYAARTSAEVPSASIGSLADKLRGALGSRKN
jgi:ribosomal protein S1